MAYKARQPFSDNMLRACPIVDNPGAIKKIVEESGAKSTDLQSPEKVEELIGKTIDVADHQNMVDNFVKEVGEAK
jgi:hypothetical protein